jgi:hypothetical protein
VVALDEREERRPRQTVQPARIRRMNDTKVSQKPGAVLVVAPIPRPLTACLTSANNAISMAKAIKVMRAAVKDRRDAIRVTVMCVEKDRRNAMNVTAAARREI